MLIAPAVNPGAVALRGFGNGPLSGHPGYWIGSRYLPSGTYTDYTALRTALGLGSPKGFDLTHLWYPMGTKPSSAVSTHTDWYGIANMSYSDALYWQRGGWNDDYTLGEATFIPTTGTQSGSGAHTPSGGSVFRRGQWPRAWDTFLAYPVIFNLGYNTPHRTAKADPPDPYVLQDIARGDHDFVYVGLGKRMAFKDKTYDRQVFPATGQRFAPAHTFINVGWENDSAQAWSFEKIKSPAGSGDPLYVAGHADAAWARDYYWGAVSRIVEKIMEGYLSYDGWTGSPSQKNCPYWFSHRWRQAAPREAGVRARDHLWSVGNPGLFRCMGVSLHDNKDSFSRPCTAADPDGMWLDKNDGSGNLCFEGLLSFGELCDKHNWKMLNDEWATHFAGGFAGGPYPDYFYLSSDRFFRKYPDLAGAYVYFYGDADADILNNPDPTATTGVATRHAIAKQHFINLYKGAAA